jgi:hypothetical protein|tara:strand:- start:4913 stop:6007 length:1095 start_codon:yes stop_codon:yes gene_type:complete
MYDVAIIGGGFYGCSIANYLNEKKKIKKIVILEKEKNIFERSSKRNQARVHNGYHYPRSLTTASRSHLNLNKFLYDFPSSIKKNNKMFYAIAKNSKTNSNQFFNFCKKIGIKIDVANKSVSKLFNNKIITEIFEVEEYAFDYIELKKNILEKIKRNNIELQLQTKVTDVKLQNKVNYLNISKPNNLELLVQSKIVINCTYSGINHINKDFLVPNLKHEVAEMALMEPPEELENYGITIMDGQYFSLMPYPSRGLHSLSHVKYTPHFEWQDNKKINPYQKLKNYKKNTLYEYMIRDASKYLPSLKNSKYVESIFEIKTILSNVEISDGRPIIFKKNKDNGSFFNILGGKIDNIYDCFKRLDSEIF